MVALVYCLGFETTFFIDDEHVILTLFKHVKELHKIWIEEKDFTIKDYNQLNYLNIITNELLEKKINEKINFDVRGDIKKINGKEIKLNIRKEEDFEIYILDVFKKIILHSINNREAIYIYFINGIDIEDDNILTYIKKKKEVSFQEISNNYKYPDLELKLLKLKRNGFITISSNSIIITDKSLRIPLFYNKSY